jgi:hypothetical protein
MAEHYSSAKTSVTIVRWIMMLDYVSDWMVDWLNKASPIADRSSPTVAEVEPQMQINSRGLKLLRQFEASPSCSEQSIQEAEQAVLRQVNVPLTANQFSALVSFTYSLGEANLRRSTLLRHLNAGRYQAAANEFSRWVYMGDRRLPELAARRMAEKELFLQTE